MKKIKLLALLFAAILLLSACSNEEEKQAIESVETAISEINIDDLNMSASIENAKALYDALSDKQKEKVENYQELVNAENKLQEAKEEEKRMLEEIQLEITDLLEIQNPKQAQVDSLVSKYEQLTEEQKSKLNGYEDAISLRRCEIIVIQAVNQYKTFLKDPSSFQLVSAQVKVDQPSLLGSGVVLKYSATNSFGGRLENVACLGIDDDGEDKFLNLSMLTGGTESYMSGKYVDYLKCAEEEIEIDPDRVMNNLGNIQ